MKLSSLLAAAFRYACVGTVLAQVLGIVLLASTGRLAPERVNRALGLAYGVSSNASPSPSTGAPAPADEGQPSYDEVLDARWNASLDLDLRETCLEKALVEYDRQSSDTARDRQRYDRVKADFDQARADQLGLASNPQLQEVRRTLEAIKPAQAKEELRKMIADGDSREVVTVLKSMPLNKRKKVVAEFKAGREADELESILKEIRLGQPEVDLIRQTRSELKTLGARTAP